MSWQDLQLFSAIITELCSNLPPEIREYPDISDYLLIKNQLKRGSDRNEKKAEK